MTESRPDSPCQKVCRLDETRSFCTTCRRTLPEIATWGRMDPGARDAVSAVLDSRSDDNLRALAQASHRGRSSRRRSV